MSLELARSLVGYYEDPDQPITQPTYDPAHDSPCPLCDLPITPTDVRTYSVMYEDRNPPLSLFYRVHKSCAVARPDSVAGLDEQALEHGQAIHKEKLQA